MTDFTQADLDRAVAAGRRRVESEPHAAHVEYDPAIDSISFRMAGDWALTVARKRLPEFRDVPKAEMRGIRLSPAGTVLHLENRDLHISIEGILEFLLTAGWMARILSRRGGRAKTKAKVRASRRNGRLGGRPRKKLSV